MQQGACRVDPALVALFGFVCIIFAGFVGLCIQTNVDFGVRVVDRVRLINLSNVQLVPQLLQFLFVLALVDPFSDLLR